MNCSRTGDENTTRNDRCSEECDERRSERKGRVAIARTPHMLKTNRYLLHGHRYLLHGQNNTKNTIAVARTKQHEDNCFTDKNKKRKKIPA